MIPTKRLSAAVLASAISLASIGGPAMAATSTHWTTSQCKTWEKSFVKRNSHASKTRKAQANKVLKGHACTVRVK
jgi:hypothetical protein